MTSPWHQPNDAPTLYEIARGEGDLMAARFMANITAYALPAEKVLELIIRMAAVLVATAVHCLPKARRDAALLDALRQIEDYTRRTAK